MSKNTDVVVIGGEYAGVMAANRSTRHDDVTVTVVNPRPVFEPGSHTWPEDGKHRPALLKAQSDTAMSPVVQDTARIV